MTVHRQVRLPLAWPWIERVREMTAEACTSAPGEVGDAALMVATELAENLIKYGQGGTVDETGLVEVEAGADRLVLRAANLATPEQARRVAEIVTRVTEVGAEALFLERLRHLMDGPREASTGLGLLRIAHEGAFTLRASFGGGILTVEATRTW